jgi:hypothetical protein
MVRTYSESSASPAINNYLSANCSMRSTPRESLGPILHSEIMRGSKRRLRTFFLQRSTELLPVHHYRNESFSSGLCAPLLEQFSSVSQFKTCLHTFIVGGVRKCNLLFVSFPVRSSGRASLMLQLTDSRTRSSLLLSFSVDIGKCSAPGVRYLWH